MIDEAGQFALADALACGTSARNLILLGDPSQLSQVVQGTHPPGSDASALAHVLAGEQTILEDRGIFLDESVRACAPSVRVHLERVLRRTAALACRLRRALDERGTGLRLLTVAHAGNSSHSPEEVAAIAAQIARLLRERITEHGGHERPITAGDIMVVAPYNAQVRSCGPRCRTA